MLTRPIMIAIAVAVAPASLRADDNFASSLSKATQTEQATLGFGCYSCAEAIFKRLKGVDSVAVGYCGGDVNNPIRQRRIVKARMLARNIARSSSTTATSSAS
jgi:hypothetical protein